MKPATKAAMTDHSKRFGGWWLLSIAALIWVMWSSPENGTVLTYKLAMVTVGLLLAYWADRVLFRHTLDIDDTMEADVVSAARLLCRAIITLAVIHGLTAGI